MIYFPAGDTATSLLDLLKLGFRGEYHVPTFHDKEYTRKQCHSARRSFGDLLEIARTYFPDTTEGELAHLLVNNLHCFYCSDIKKLVFMSYGSCGFDARMRPQYNSTFQDSANMSYNQIKQLAEDYEKTRNESNNKSESQTNVELAGVDELSTANAGG